MDFYYKFFGYIYFMCEITVVTHQICCEIGKANLKNAFNYNFVLIISTILCYLCISAIYVLVLFMY